MKMKRMISVLLAALSLLICLSPFSLAYYYDKVSETEESKYICVEETCSSSDGSGYCRSYAYDAQGLLVERVANKTDENGKKKGNVTRYTYDQNGNVLKEVCKSVNKIWKRVTSHAYDEKGKEIKTVVLAIKADGSCQKSKYLYAYDSKGNLAKKVYIPDCSAEKRAFRDVTRYTCNEKGQVLTETRSVKKVDGSIYRKETTSVYNENGKIEKQESVWSRSDRKPGSSMACYTYDKNGNETEVLRCEKTKGKIIYKERFKITYDKAGNPIKENFYFSWASGGTYKLISVNQFDEKGNLTEFRSKTVDEVGVFMKSHFVCTYDDNGNALRDYCVSRDRESEGVDKEVVDYTYDEAGNLIKVVETATSGDGKIDKTIFTYSYEPNKRLAAGE